MDQGKVLLTGSVEELTASDTVTLIGLANIDDVVAAGQTLQARGLQAEPEGKLIRIFGEKGGLDWRQEEPNLLVWSPLGEAPRLIRRGSAAMNF